MSYPQHVTKPHDVAVARAIGTYPELPMTGDNDYDFARVDEITAEAHTITWTGPAGTVVSTLQGGAITAVQERSRDLRGGHAGDGMTAERVYATGREETEACEAGTPGCSIDHTRDSGDGCEGW